jgi:hypothetical protein
MTDTAVDRIKTIETRRANMAKLVDFDRPRAEDEFVRHDGRMSPYTKKLEALIAGIQSGEGEIGMFYPIATFTSKSGARTTVRNLHDHPDRLPHGATFDVKAHSDGHGGSELWVAVVALDD